jgi:hypothetical protein
LPNAMMVLLSSSLSSSSSMNRVNIKVKYDHCLV